MFFFSIIRALEKIRNSTGAIPYNLGTGNGYSVLEIVKAFEKTNNIKVKYEITPRRPGDIAECYADPTKARTELNWVAEKTLEVTVITYKEGNVPYYEDDKGVKVYRVDNYMINPIIL